MATVNVTVVDTKVFPGQKPGTSGLRKQVNEFMEEHYMENFIQCTLDAMGKDLKGSTLVVGGDGRYGVTLATDKIIKMAAANEVRTMQVCRAVGRSENPGVPIVIRWAYVI